MILLNPAATLDALFEPLCIGLRARGSGSIRTGGRRSGRTTVRRSTWSHVGARRGLSRGRLLTAGPLTTDSARDAKRDDGNDVTRGGRTPIETSLPNPKDGCFLHQCYVGTPRRPARAEPSFTSGHPAGVRVEMESVGHFRIFARGIEEGELRSRGREPPRARTRVGSNLLPWITRHAHFGSLPQLLAARPRDRRRLPVLRRCPEYQPPPQAPRSALSGTPTATRRPEPRHLVCRRYSTIRPNGMRRSLAPRT